jgi:uncharacterized membrane protein
MRSLFGFVKSTLLGGFLFLLPIGIVVIVLARLVAYAGRAGDAIDARLFPGASGDLLPLVFALVLLLLAAFAAGSLARTAFGRRMFAWLEAAILANLPAYMVVRQTVADMTGGSVALTGGAGTEVVLVRLDDMSVLGFLIERLANGDGIVYLPGAPSALSGSVARVEGARISATALKPAEVVQGMRRLGAGLAAFRI